MEEEEEEGGLSKCYVKVVVSMKRYPMVATLMCPVEGAGRAVLEGEGPTTEREEERLGKIITHSFQKSNIKPSHIVIQGGGHLDGEEDKISPSMPKNK